MVENKYSAAGRDLAKYLEPSRFGLARQAVTLDRRNDYGSGGKVGSGSYKAGYIPRPKRRSYSSGGSGAGNVLAGTSSKILRV